MNILEKIYDLEPDESRLLYSEEVKGQLIEVREWQHYRWLHVGGDFIQALVDLDEKNELVLPNLAVMVLALLLVPSPKRLLNLGLGGVSLERFLDTHFPEIRIDSIESDEQIIQIAKDYFFLPDEVNVVHAQAEHFLSTCNDNYDIVLCDIFSEEKQASCLYDATFYADIAHCLDEKGVLAMNVLPESEQDVIDLILPMKNHFGNLYLYEVPEHFNVVLFASHVKLPELNELKIKTDNLFKKTNLDLREVPERINRLLETI